MAQKDRPQTPDGRYFVARGQLRRCTDPSLNPTTRRAGIKALMQARRAALQVDSDPAASASAGAIAAVDAAKRMLGERGPVWWPDDAPDQSGMEPASSSYAGWWAALDGATRALGG
ncbi:hypothetical protein [Roseovarius sp. M141]|uniref:hypothetical protein n=1 Tax=Roseovarius sp. M141 TaxID=2583806 RepID=UPI0020CC1EA9|nr:hypothetical protein [Roseovarius sp. M141]MCQ0093360.1 hypothetical protein [Roseovarius sp. M141]